MADIVVVEDEVALNNLIHKELLAEGHTVRQAFDGPSALRIVEESAPDLVILDWMLPGLDGLAVCRQLRQTHLMPIIMLTARTEEVDRVMGLEVGADDYVVKPFGMRELLARTRAALRRVDLDSRRAGSATVESGEAPIVRGPLRMDREAHTADLNGEGLSLTPKEFDLLALFAANPGRAFNRGFLIERVWGGEFEGYDRAVDNHIRGLRKKLGSFGESIETVWGVGYRFLGWRFRLGRAASWGSIPLRFPSGRRQIDTPVDPRYHALERIDCRVALRAATCRGGTSQDSKFSAMGGFLAAGAAGIGCHSGARDASPGGRCGTGCINWAPPECWLPFSWWARTSRPRF